MHWSVSLAHQGMVVWSTIANSCKINEGRLSKTRCAERFYGRLVIVTLRFPASLLTKRSFISLISSKEISAEFRIRILSNSRRVLRNCLQKPLLIWNLRYVWKDSLANQWEERWRHCNSMVMFSIADYHMIPWEILPSYSIK